MSERLAVVGTDTGVGKTVVTAALARWLRDRGDDVRAVKPAQTGNPPDDDAAFVAAACGDPDAATCPRYLEPPLAPRVAAERAGEALEYDELLAACERALAKSAVGIVEGIGGLRVPLAGDREVIDLVAALECRAILVARSTLGTLNHTALSVEALRRREIPVAAVVCNRYEGASAAERTNPAELRRQLDVPVGTVRPVDATDPVALAAGVSEELAGAFDAEALLGRS